MNVDGKHYRTIWLHADSPGVVQIIDQTKLPFQFIVVDLTSFEEAKYAISSMQVRGAGLIGATAAFAMYLAAYYSKDNWKEDIVLKADELKATRPTAVNLQWAVDQQVSILQQHDERKGCIEAMQSTAMQIADDDAAMCRKIGQHGVKLVKDISKQKSGKTVNVLTHCNAGWLAFVDYGSATAPIYEAHNQGIDIHVWVDETRPRNQGARLTAWELLEHGVPHTVIPDNTGGHLMQHGLVDLVITGADRVTASGDAANKIGTYLKSLAAKDNQVPFYVALPSSTFDWNIHDGIADIPIEQRDAHEVRYMSGIERGEEHEVLIMPEGSNAANYGFDVTPARLITGLISERGICVANKDAISKLFPEIAQ